MNCRQRRAAFTVGKSATHPLRNWWLDVTVQNPEAVPDTGGAIIAANHLSFIDSMLLMYGLGRPVSFLGKVEYLDSFATRHLFPAVGMIPVDRSGANGSKALREARRRIEKGELIGIFPEGTRSRDGLLHMGHGGVAHLSLKTGTPIIPVGISGTDSALPVGSRAPRRAPITITLGSLIGPGGRGGRTASMRQRQALTAEVMESIAALSGQERACEESAATATGSKSVGA